MRRRYLPAITATRALLLAAVVVLGAAVFATRHAWQRPDPAVVAAAAALGVDPDSRDPHAWRAAAAQRFDANDYAGAVAGYARATELDPGNASGWSALGEARVMASESQPGSAPVPPEAEAAFAKALALDPGDPRARYFVAVKRDVDGDHAGAIAAWLALLGDTPPGAPWEADLKRTITQVGKINGIAVAERLAAVKQPPVRQPPVMQPSVGQPARGTAGPPAAPVPGPTAADLAAASHIAPSQQRAMAEGMVARLDARLAAAPHDAPGWLMLIRSRAYLGQTDAARAALARATAADPDDAATIRDGAAQLGVR